MCILRGITWFWCTFYGYMEATASASSYFAELTQERGGNHEWRDGQTVGAGTRVLAHRYENNQQVLDVLKYYNNFLYYA